MSARDRFPFIGHVPSGYPISEAQGRRLYAIAMTAHWTPEALEDFLRSRGYARIREVYTGQYDDVIAALREGPLDTFPVDEDDERGGRR